MLASALRLSYEPKHLPAWWWELSLQQGLS